MRKKVYSCLIACALICGFALAACNNNGNASSSSGFSEVSSEVSSEESITSPVVVLPKEIEGTNKDIALDVYTQNKATINPLDYIDPNGLTDLSYSLVVSDTGVATAAKENDSFAVSPVAVGNTTAVLSALKANESLLDVNFNISVVNTAPTAPIVDGTVFNYDICAGGKFEVPVEMNRGEASILKIDEERLNETIWNFNETTSCLEIEESFMLGLSKGSHAVNFVTTGGSVEFAINVFNSIVTSFDEVTEKEVNLGQDEYVGFELHTGEATITKVMFDDIQLSSDDYEYASNELKIKSSFFKQTHAGDERTYKVFLSNRDSYEFSINVANQIFYTDYDVTTIHDTLVSTDGHNSLYQDSTRVEIVNAPENSGFSGKVLKFIPHQEDVAFDCHGVYTLSDNTASNTWHKVPLDHGASYLMSFDYMTEGTTAGEDFSFRSWYNSVHAALDTGKPGQLQHFSHVFQWDDAQLAVLVFGKFLNGGCIYFDNVRLVKLSNSEISLNAPNYLDQESYEADLLLNGIKIKDVLLNGASTNYEYANNKLTIPVATIAALEKGTHKITVKTELLDLEANFERLSNGLIETSKTFNIGVEQIKLSGVFSSSLSVARVYRQGANNLDWINGAWQECSAAYLELQSDGLVVKKGLLDQIYETCTISAYLSDNSEIAFTLTSDAVWYCNFDETMTWHSSLTEPYANWSIVEGVEGMTGKCLKTISTSPDTGNWWNRVFCFEKVGVDFGWNAWTIDDNKNYEITFDMKVELNGAVHDNSDGYLGYQYCILNHHETSLLDYGYVDGQVKHVRIAFKGADMECFCIGVDPRRGDTVSALYMDNFRVKEVH